MLDHAREAVMLAEGKAEGDLRSNRLLQLGLVRLVEIIGEAAARVPPEEREQHPEIPWGDVIGMRNKLIHGYDTVDLGILWDTVTNELPGLIRVVESILSTKGAE
jgi:uncharacterized protein with HEPN domain